jgi:hypothetical protein
MSLDALSIARVLVSARLKTMPTVFRPIARLRENNKRIAVRPNSDLAIEGYWRCGNHFATYAFITSQPKAVHVAHHFHAPAQLMLAIRWGVPAVLLVREPVAAVSSATVFLQQNDPRPFLKFFNVFHAALVPYRERLIISDFERTTGDFGSVIAEVNKRFGKHYALYQGSHEERQRVDDAIRREHTENMGADAATLPLPDATKDLLKERIRQRLASSECTELLTEAHRLYDLFVATAVRSG